MFSCRSKVTFTEVIGYLLHWIDLQSVSFALCVVVFVVGLWFVCLCMCAGMCICVIITMVVAAMMWKHPPEH